MIDRNRRLALLFSALAVIAMLLLAAGLGGLELQPGHPFAGRLTAADEEGPGPGRAPVVLADTLLLVLGLLIASLALLGILYLFLGADRRKRWLYALVLLLGLLAVYRAMLAEPPPELPAPATVVPPEIVPEGESLSSPAVPTVELEVKAPAWLAWLAAGLLALIAAALILGTIWLFWVRAQQPRGPLPQLAEQARVALAELEAGADVRDTIMRCYLEMSRVLEQERGLTRDQAMTPREFEAALRNTGLPREPVTRLTRLFEAVRYGAARPGRGEEDEAMASLSAIVAACRSAA